ncbi:MAG: hypothetical protein J6S67_19740 [Methanobrevibacter sp.]|nr:hypothetical protein [Methanobrevibacter sp.]
MKYFIQIKTNPWDNAQQTIILEISGASEETRNIILSNYKGENYIIKSVPEEETLTSADGIETLDLSIRSYNCLKRAGIHTVLDLIKTYNKGELYVVRNLGRKSCDEIENKLVLLKLVRRLENDRP